MISKVVLADWRSRSRSIARCDAHYNDEDGNVDGSETSPRPKSSMSVPFMSYSSSQKIVEMLAYSHPIFSNFLTLAHATTSTKDKNAHHTVQAA